MLINDAEADAGAADANMKAKTSATARNLETEAAVIAANV